MRSLTLACAALLLGLTGCVTKMVDQSCQDRGYSPGSALYAACYPSAATAIARTYGGAAQASVVTAAQTAFAWPYLLTPPPPP
jgi:hypothetical protein